MFPLRIALFSLLLSFLFPLPILASDFSTNLESTHTVSETNSATTTHRLTVTNNNATQYPTGFELIIPGAITTPIKVTQASGKAARFTTNTTDRFTQLNLIFPEPVVGEGKSQSYLIEYQNSNLIHGQPPYEQYVLPGLPSIDQTATGSSTLILPDGRCPKPTAFPAATSISPSGPTTIRFENYLPSQSFFIRCADTRNYSLLLRYFLTNTNLTPIETQITLPPDTTNQQLFFNSIDPEPLAISTDTDGNVIASFKLEPKEAKQITVNADAVVSALPITTGVPALHTYLAAQPHWPTHQSSIKSLAKTLADPPALFAYLTQQTALEATVSGIRTGGSLLTITPQSLQPLDLVDSFITLARTKGIMSRRLLGFAQSPNQVLWPATLLENKLHVWADYFDPATQTWISVDPIWQKTSLGNYYPIHDLNHLVLAINGTNDTAPYPVGYYQSPDAQAPDIQITDIPFFTPPPAQVSGTINRPFLHYLGLSTQGQLVIQNHGRFSVYNQPMTLNFDDKPTQPLTLTRLPLEGQAIIPITLPPYYEKATLTINQTGIPLTKGATDYTAAVALTVILAASLGGLAFIAWRLLVFRRKRARSLRR